MKIQQVKTRKTGVLYGVGVGPGDPELLTFKALKVLRSVAMIFAASSSENDYSIAHDIVRHHIKDLRVRILPFPMTRDEARLSEAWEKNARQVLGVLEEGKDAAFITIGDPSTYSTFGYLQRMLLQLRPEAQVRIIPGVTAFSAAAARVGVPLVEGEESLHLISGATGRGKLKKAIEDAENVVVLKTYRHFDDIYQALEELDMLEKGILVSKCGLEGEMIEKDIRQLSGIKPSYLSLLIIKQRPYWLLSKK